MEQGELIEQGNHEELMLAQGAYWRLYQAQARSDQANAMDMNVQDSRREVL
jgi:ATP-binding cassette subfamily B protein